MKYQLLGRSGLRVSELCLGTMTFGEEWGWGASKNEATKIFEAYVERDGNFIDTANYYTAGASERFVGELIGSERERFVLATKYTLNMRRGDANAGGNHRKNMFQSVHASLERLNTDYIDLLWLHIWDTVTPIEEVMRGLDDLVRMGKVHYVGISDTPAWVISKANTLASLRGWSPFIGLQIQYNLVERTSERELLPMADDLGIGVTAWSPLAGGILTGKHNKEAVANSESKRSEMLAGRLTERNRAIAEAVLKIAEELNCAPSQVALNWLRQQKRKIIPIIGARKAAQAVENLDCLNWKLTGEHLARLNEVSRIEMGFPHDMIMASNVKDMIWGGVEID